MSSYNEDETLSTLRFGFRAKNIKNKPKVNRELSAKELQKLLDKAKEEIRELKEYANGIEEELKIYKKGGIKTEIKIQDPTESTSKESDAKEADLKRQELEEKLNELLPTLSKYREKCVLLEKELVEEKQFRNRIMDENIQLKDEINQAKEEGAQSLEDIHILKEQLKEKSDYLATAESYRNDLEKIIQLKTNECQEVKDSMKEERRKLEYVVKEKDSEVEEHKKQMEHYCRQLNESKIQLLTLQSKQDDPDLELVMNFIDKKFKKITKTAKKESDRDRLRKRRESFLTLRKIKTDLKNIQEEMDESDDDSDDDGDETGDTDFNEAEFMLPSPPQEVVLQIPPTPTAIDDSDYFTEPVVTNEEAPSSVLTQVPESERLSEALERIRELEVTNKNLKSERDNLLEDLSNRVDKVIELEVQLDEITDKYNTLSNQNIIKKYSRKIEWLERNLEQVTVNLSQVHNENSEIIMKLSLAEKKIRMKEERLTELNNIIVEQTRKAKKEADMFVEERSKLNDTINTLKRELDILKHTKIVTVPPPQIEIENTSSKVRRPLRGGGSKPKKTEEDEYFSSPGSTAELDVELDSSGSSASKYATIRKPSTASTHRRSTFSLKELFFGKSKSENINLDAQNVDLDDK